MISTVLPENDPAPSGSFHEATDESPRIGFHVILSCTSIRAETGNHHTCAVLGILSTIFALSNTLIILVAVVVLPFSTTVAVMARFHGFADPTTIGICDSITSIFMVVLLLPFKSVIYHTPTISNLRL